MMSAREQLPSTNLVIVQTNSMPKRPLPHGHTRWPNLNWFFLPKPLFFLLFVVSFVFSKYWILILFSKYFSKYYSLIKYLVLYLSILLMNDGEFINYSSVLFLMFLCFLSVYLPRDLSKCSVVSSISHNGHNDCSASFSYNSFSGHTCVFDNAPFLVDDVLDYISFALFCIFSIALWLYFLLYVLHCYYTMIY